MVIVPDDLGLKNKISCNFFFFFVFRNIDSQLHDEVTALWILARDAVGVQAMKNVLSKVDGRWTFNFRWRMCLQWSRSRSETVHFLQQGGDAWGSTWAPCCETKGGVIQKHCSQFDLNASSCVRRNKNWLGVVQQFKANSWKWACFVIESRVSKIKYLMTTLQVKKALLVQTSVSYAIKGTNAE